MTHVTKKVVGVLDTITAGVSLSQNSTLQTGGSNQRHYTTALSGCCISYKRDTTYQGPLPSRL